MTRLFNDPSQFADEMIEGFEAAASRWVRAVPGGVGPMTIACLLANTVTCASLINGLEPPKDLTV
jgi:5,10-methylene-tetrahydrofolate dehydrogenase/methenyl tetrahydrofolate cyclohydrolase